MGGKVYLGFFWKNFMEGLSNFSPISNLEKSSGLGGLWFLGNRTTYLFFWVFLVLLTLREKKRNWFPNIGL